MADREAPSRPRPEHIVWDWNGTLLADNHAVLAAVNAVCEEFERAPIDLEHWRAIFSRPLQACYERLLDRSLDAADWARIDALYHDAYRELLHTCGLADGVPERLHVWAEAGGSQSLLSMWFHEELVPLVEKLGLAELFDRVDGIREQVGGGSKAAYLQRHLERLGRRPHEAVLIGDVVDDAEAAAQVGAHCVLVSTGVMSRASLVETGVPVCDSVEEAVARIAAPTG
ncbi:HAD hydrolase-like protein [Salinifilum aidingensis]